MIANVCLDLGVDQKKIVQKNSSCLCSKSHFSKPIFSRGRPRTDIVWCQCHCKSCQN